MFGLMMHYAQYMYVYIENVKELFIYQLNL